MIPPEIYAETLLEFFAPIRPFIDDPTVSDIVINGPAQIYVERRGKLELTGAVFEGHDELLAALRNAAQYVGKTVDPQHPILEGRLPDGSRIEAILPPAAPDGPYVAIRKFPKQAVTMGRLVESGSLTELAAHALRAFVASKLNIMISGGTGTGKTSVLNALSSYIPEGERVVVIEDSKEVQLQRQHVLQLESRPADPRGRGAVSIRELFKATLRMRPDRIVIGEVRGAEALEIVQAMTSGHGGCLATLHATHPRDALTRLETMAMMSDVELPLSALRMQIASAVNLIVQVARMNDGSRKITHVSEVIGFEPERGGYAMQDLFVREYQGGGGHGDVSSKLVPTGTMPRCLGQLQQHGVELPSGMLTTAKRARDVR